MTPRNLELRGTMAAGFEEVITPDALEFVAELQHRFGPRRAELLQERAQRRARLRAGEMLGFLHETREIREGNWSVAPVPDDLQQRWVEITGPTDRKMTINALNSGADGFMADFEDANSPTWHNMVDGHRNLRDAIDGTITYYDSDGKYYELSENPATLLVRPRGWHLPERHLLVDSDPVSGSLFDFGLYVFHCARRLLRNGTAPYFYLPKMESHLEARLWNDVFVFSQDVLGIPHGTFKATVLIETLPAAFEMDEILYELREHSAGLNAGRWDYIFSSIKCFPDRPEMVLPDRSRRDHDRAVYARLHRVAGRHLPQARGPRDGRDGGVDPSPQGHRARTSRRSRPCATTRSARSPRATTAPGWRTRISCRSRARCSRTGLEARPTRSSRRRDDVHVSAGELLDLGLDARRRSPRRACGPTSTSASSTSRSG